MVKSIQDVGDALGFLRSYISMVDDINIKLPNYRADTRERDKVLLAFSRSEPLLAGVLSTVISRDKNRSWSLTGGARLVSKYGRILHELDNFSGWRNFISNLSTAFYSTNIGYVAEIGVDDRGVPQSMWPFDPTKIRLTGFKDPSKESLYYYPPTGKVPLMREDYIHGNSMPSIEDEYNGAGFCAVERSIVVSKIMIGLFKHQLEKLGVAPPKGLLHAKGITLDEFQRAVDMANESASNADYEFYKGILSLFTSNTDSSVELIGFSQLPDNFEMKDFIDIVMQSYSLAFNYPVGQFWSIASGSFGRTGEMKVQEAQATAKGELEFALSLQEQMQSWFLPNVLYFEFDVRDDSGKLIRIEAESKEISSVVDLYHAGRGQANGDEPMITKEQALELLAAKGYVPNEWTATEEEDVVEDLKYLREKIRSNANIVRRSIRIPDEPILMYRWNPLNDVFGGFVNTNSTKNWRTIKAVYEHFMPQNGTVTVLFDSAEDLFERKIF